MKLIEDERHARIFGVRPDRTFEQAAAKFVVENTHKVSLRDDVCRLENLMPMIGHLPIRHINMGVLAPWIAQRRADGVAIGTINHGLQVVRRIMNLAATEWHDEHGLTWLAQPPKIKLLPDRGKRKPYPLSWDEQDRLFAELPEHLCQMALFKVNTGLRDGDVCGLLWEDEVPVPELDISVFVIPVDRVKDTDYQRDDDRLVVLNSAARHVVKERRGQHPTHVFSYKDAPIDRMGNSAWYKAKRRAGLPQVRVHDLKHTFGRRLRAAGVKFEDRQDLLGHRSTRMTTHYSAAEVLNLIEMAELVAEQPDRESQPLLVINRRRRTIPAKSPQSDEREDRVTTQVLEIIGSGGGT